MTSLKPLFLVCSVFSLIVLTWKINPVHAANKGSIELKFNGLNSSKGQVCFNLFSGSKGFPDGGKASDLKIARCTPITQGVAEITLTDIPYGSYAISAVHDTNGDQRLNSNFFGVPKEGVGFSNNVQIKMASPSFGESQFPVSSSRTTVQIKLQYFN